MSNRRLTFLTGLALGLAVFAVYQNSLEAPFLFDDTPAIISNHSIRQLGSWREVLNPPVDGSSVTGRPIVNLSFAINYAFGGLNVWGYHLTNLLLHLVATLLLWGVLRRTCRWLVLQKRFGADAEILAGCMALLWAVHPLLTESVTCVVQRTEGLGGLFYLLVFYCFIRSTQSNTRERIWQGLTVATCLVGMASKEILATAPLLLFLYDRTFAAGTFRAAWQRRKILYVALMATWLWLAWLMSHAEGRAGTVGFGHGVSSWHYLLTQCDALTIYLKLSFWPHPLVVDYGTTVVSNIREVWWQGPLIIALGCATLFALWRRPILGFVGAWFFVILAPSSSFVPLVTQTIAEHRMYLPLVAVIVLVVAGLHQFAGRRAPVICLMVAAVFGTLTVFRNAAYRDELSLWAGNIKERPENPRAHSGLGSVYYSRGDLTTAMREYEEARRLEPRSGQIYYNIGLVYGKLDRLEEAVACYYQAVKVVATMVAAHVELGDTLLKLGRLEEARKEIQLALDHSPDVAEAHNSLGRILASGGRLSEAVVSYQRAIAINPNFAPAEANLGAVLFALKQYTEAVSHLERALRLAPELADAHFDLALNLGALGRSEEAMIHYAEAVRLKPGHADARLNLGVMLAQSGRVPEALAQLGELVRRQPDRADAHANLGIVLALAERPEEAVTSYETALRLRPDYGLAHYNLGNALLAVRRWSEAKQHFAEAVRLLPENADAREMLERMNSSLETPENPQAP